MAAWQHFYRVLREALPAPCYHRGRSFTAFTQDRRGAERVAFGDAAVAEVRYDVMVAKRSRWIAGGRTLSGRTARQAT
jgi:hypothetical protein